MDLKLSNEQTAQLLAALLRKMAVHKSSEILECSYGDQCADQIPWLRQEKAALLAGAAALEAVEWTRVATAAQYDAWGRVLQFRNLDSYGAAGRYGGLHVDEIEKIRGQVGAALSRLEAL